MNKWKMVKLGEVYEITSSKRVFQSEWTDKGIPFYRAREIAKLSVDGFVNNELFITEQMYEDYSNKYGKPNAGDIMVTGVGTLGICYVVKDSDEFYFKDGNIIWLKHKSNIDSNYVKWAFKSNSVREQISRNSSGTTVGTYTITNAKETIIPFPPLETQKQIAKTLDTATELLAMRKQQLAELDNLIKSTFYDMFGDPIANEKGWRIHLIEDAIVNEKNAIKAGPFGSALKKEFYVEQGYKIYGQEQVINNDATYGDYYISESKYKELENCAVQEDDVLISLVGTYGRLLIIPKKFDKGIINPRLMKITFDKTKVNTTYFKYYFVSESLKNVLSRMSRGGTMDILNVGIVRKLAMPLPPLDLQTIFASIVTKIQEQKALVQKAINETQYLFDSLMNEYFE